MLCLYLWACVAALSPVIVLFRSHMAALQHPTQSSISLPLLRCLAVALLHNVQLWSGVVWWETSAPLLLQNPLITWFCLCVALFHIPAMWREREKKEQKHTNSVQMTTEEIQLQETHSPPTLPWAHSGLCCMRTRMRGWACCMLCAINNYSSALESKEDLLPASFSLYCPNRNLSRRCMQTASGISVVTELGSTSTFWSLVRRWKLSHVWGSRTGKSLAVSWLATFLVCGLVIRAGPRHVLADLGLYWNHPAFLGSYRLTAALCVLAVLEPHLGVCSIPVRCLRAARAHNNNSL